MANEAKECPPYLTVVIRNDAPMVHCGDSPSYRTVRVILTEQQRAAIKLEWVGSQGGNDFYEEVSKAIIE